MTPVQSNIAENVARVRQRMAAAAARSGRSPECVRLLAVTKYVGLEEIRQLVAAGCTDLGESRPQQLWQRAAALDDLPIGWHLIGHLQRNKARRTVPLIAMLHSADSAELIDALDRLAGETSRRLPILLEVNIAGEASKHGFAPDAIEPLVERWSGYRNLDLRGLMCMAGLEGGPDQARRDFSALRALHERLAARLPDGLSLAELSMGMSGDYEVAIEEGATMVRVGSALFEGPPP